MLPILFFIEGMTMIAKDRILPADDQVEQGECEIICGKYLIHYALNLFLNMMLLSPNITFAIGYHSIFYLSFMIVAYSNDALNANDLS